jgi:hypothetical protein
MRARLLITVALVLGVIALVYVAGRKSSGPVEASNLSATNTSPAKTTFKKMARVSAADSGEASAPGTSSNLFDRLVSGEVDLELSTEQWAEYLRRYGTNAETLLATQKKDYLKLAAELFPDDPRVQYAVLTRELFPEARREWLDRFKHSAPDNAVADYLSARDYLKAGDRENALKDLANAAGKSRFDDYTLGQVQDMEDAQLSAGRTLFEAKVAASSELLLPQMVMFKNLAQEIQTVQKEYIGAGDAASAEALAQMGRALAQQLTHGGGSHTILGELVGLAAERIVLSQLPPDSHPSFLNGTVQQRLDEMTALRQDIRSLATVFGEALNTLSEPEIISYFDRMKLQGEHKAMLWLQNRNKLR